MGKGHGVGVMLDVDVDVDVDAGPRPQPAGAVTRPTGNREPGQLGHWRPIGVSGAVHWHGKRKSQVEAAEGAAVLCHIWSRRAQQQRNAGERAASSSDRFANGVDGAISMAKCEGR